MASIVNSLRNITSDAWWFVKITVFINADIIFQHHQTNLIILLSILIIYLGSQAVMVSRNINNETPILPSLKDLPLIIFKGLISVLVMLPSSVIFYMVINFIKNSFVFEPFIMFIIYACVSLIFVPFIVIPFILFCVNGNIADAFKINKVMEASGNFIVQILSYFLQYLFTIFLMFVLLYKLITEMLGFSQLVEILVGYTIAITIFSLFSYCSDMYGDIIPEIKSKKRRL